MSSTVETQQTIADDTQTLEVPAEELSNNTDENEDFDPSKFYDTEEVVAEPDEGDADLDADGEVLEPIAAPTSWKAEDKAEWEALPRNVQETVARRERERDSFLTTKAREAATVEQRVRAEAEQQLAQIHRNSAQELTRYAAMFQAPQPDPALLYTGNPQDALTYQQQEVAYRASVAQQQQLQQQAQERATEAQRIEEQQAHTVRQADVQVLQQALPDWFDSEKGPKLQQTLQSIGSTLGYPVELMADATAQDIIALKTASDWKAKADKYDALISKKMSAVSRARQQLPRIARPGTGVAQPTSDPVKLLYPND
jgi:hypothetical protein